MRHNAKNDKLHTSLNLVENSKWIIDLTVYLISFVHISKQILILLQKVQFLPRVNRFIGIRLWLLDSKRSIHSSTSQAGRKFLCQTGGCLKDVATVHTELCKTAAGFSVPPPFCLPAVGSGCYVPCVPVIVVATIKSSDVTAG